MVAVRPPLAELLDLRPHPEGGWYRETWAAATRVPPDGDRGGRATASAIHFLLEPGEESRWHRVRSDEVWLWHRGGPLTLQLGGTGERPDPQSRIVTVGGALERGEALQAVVPASTWQTARPATGRSVLVSCVVSPGFDHADFELLASPD